MEGILQARYVSHQNFGMTQANKCYLDAIAWNSGAQRLTYKANVQSLEECLTECKNHPQCTQALMRGNQSKNCDLLPSGSRHGSTTSQFDWYEEV